MREQLSSIQSLVDNVSKVVVGKDETIRLIIASLLSRGHVLLEDKPGVGKTMLARALAGILPPLTKEVKFVVAAFCH